MSSRDFEGGKMTKGRREVGSAKKSETVTVRFDPHLKYLAELAARRQRRPLSSFIEWCVEQTVLDIVIAEGEDHKDVTIAEADKKLHLWESGEPERLIRLALNYPDLLTFEEQRLWRLLCKNGYFWKGSFVGDPPLWGWIADLRSVDWDHVREYWELLREVAAEKISSLVLPRPPEPPLDA
jgi:hypothetical protein